MESDRAWTLTHTNNWLQAKKDSIYTLLSRKTSLSKNHLSFDFYPRHQPFLYVHLFSLKQSVMKVSQCRRYRWCLPSTIILLSSFCSHFRIVVSLRLWFSCAHVFKAFSLISWVRNKVKYWIWKSGVLDEKLFIIIFHRQQHKIIYYKEKMFMYLKTMWMKANCKGKNWLFRCSRWLNLFFIFYCCLQWSIKMIMREWKNFKENIKEK